MLLFLELHIHAHQLLMRNMLLKSFAQDVADDAELFTKAILNGTVLHCANYKRKSTRKNCIVEIENKIIELVVFPLLRFSESEDTCSIAFARERKLKML